jgi:DNA replication protein DnaC
VGKTHIAVGVAMEAKRRSYVVRYSTLDDLVRDLRKADRLGKLREKLSYYQRSQLLILDEVGYLPSAGRMPAASSSSSEAATSKDR